MVSEKERWDTLNKLDMGYSLDEGGDKKVIEDIIVDDATFLEASKGLFNRGEYMQAKSDVELSYALMEEPSKSLVDKLVEAKKNVEAYINAQRVFKPAK